MPMGWMRVTQEWCYSKCPTTYSMDVQGIHCQVIGVQIELLEKLFQGELFALGIINYTVNIHTV